MNIVNNFNISSFCRTIWLSAEAKTVWEKTVNDIGPFVQELEIDSVAEGQRLCAWQTIAEDKAIDCTRKWADKGLVSLPVTRVAQFRGFAHKHEAPKEGQLVNLCFVVSKEMKNCVEYSDAFKQGDHREQGRLLGFPSCCTEFFTTVWGLEFIDPIWQMAEKSNIIESSEHQIKVRAHHYSNPLLRYAGIRLSFHIPCSFSCGATIAMASERMKLAKEKNADLATLLEALLQMQMRWDCLHGLAVIKTPIFFLDVQSVPCTENYIVDVEGSFTPREAVYG